ncbi:hypothetical protein NUH88_09115 [Nisaea acidiphila]|uniref:Uncharacterized protein n=1 Tax=Nisaea acidiphila TaxID=1862145 RepID=A0A9J7AWV7_9PROT|nr:hypothetical protein [Nisaea acidiphila]UUX51847.1 hypothetical protein NUH88_09115 [Nisaea acidiphila]
MGSPYCRGQAKIEHNTTKQVFTISPNDSVWQHVSSTPREMGSENHYEFTVEHDALGTLTWSVWEYPEGVYNEQETDSGPHKVIENLDVGINP